MKISASIYSDKNNPIQETIKNLNDSHVDMIHVDCNDDLNVFEDIKLIIDKSQIPIDLHIITDKPKKFYPYLTKYKIEYVTFQYENLREKKLQIPNDFNGQKGLAITSNTEISVFEEFSTDFDFILFMATIPGQSGGKFDKLNFRKIRAFQQKYPNKNVHVDGGVNAEVSFILRNMGVYCSVSGSYLFNSANINTALLNLKLADIESKYQVKDFMRDLKESPTVYEKDLNLENVLRSMAAAKLGFTMVLNSNNKLLGIIGNADLRNGLLAHLKDLDAIKISDFINKNPLTIGGHKSVYELLRLIKKETRSIIYLPVVDEEGKAIGTINFMNLIKGEI